MTMMRPPPRQHSGFTLIEMMVVLLIIGIVVGSVVLSVNTDDLKEHMEIEMNRLRALVNLAREEAILQDHDMALVIKEDSYSFQWYDVKQQKWLAVDDGRVFRERKLPPGTNMVLLIEDLPSVEKHSQPGTTLELDGKDQEQQQEEEDVQRVVIYPSGEVFPFELILQKEDESTQFKLVADADGELSVQLPDEIS